MSAQNRNRIAIVTLATACLFTASCGLFKKKSSGDSSGGSDSFTNILDRGVSSTNSELRLSSKLTIIPPKKDSASLALSDYEDDVTNVFVEEKSTDALSMASMILCIFSKTGYTEQVNKGAYIAQVDMDKCESSKQGGSSGGGQGGGSNKQIKLVPFVMKSTREDGKPLVVNSWFSLKEDSGERKMQVKFVVAEGARGKNPVGSFLLGWHETTGMMNGILEAKSSDDGSNVKVSIYEKMEMSEGGKSIKEIRGAAATINLDDSGDAKGGKLNVYVSEPDWSQMGGKLADNKESTFKVAFDSSKFLRNDGSSDKCLSREKFNTQVYGYGLYKDGSRVNLNSGFPGEIGGKHAYASYWGIWLDGNGNATDGSTFVQKDNEGNDKKSYTVKVAPGKLTKNTRKTATLLDLKGVPLNYWSNGSNYRVEWNGSKFVKTAKQNSQGMWEDITQEDFAVTNEWEQYRLNFYAESLNAQLNIDTNGSGVGGLTNASPAVYFVQEVVSGKTVPATLYCWVNCPKVGQTSSQDTMTNKETSDKNSPYTFTWDTSTLGLKYGGQAVSLGANYSDQWGTWSGPLLDETAKAAFVADSSVNSIWDVNLVSEYYTWSMGNNNWDKFVGLVDGSSFVSFDKPISITYTHTADNDFDGSSGKYVGKRFELQYGGYRQLWGFPWETDKDLGYMIPAFSLKPGSKVGDYVAKPTDMAQKMKELSSSECSDLSHSDVPELPTADDLSKLDPSGIGDAPSTTKVLYVDGVAQ